MGLEKQVTNSAAGTQRETEAVKVTRWEIR